MFSVTHSEWGEEPYGWQVRMSGEVIDTYADKRLAETYCAYMNARNVQPQRKGDR